MAASAENPQFEINPQSLPGRGYKSWGCLERESDPTKPWFPMIRDLVKADPLRRSDVGDLIQERTDRGLSFRQQHIKTILDQDGRGSCAVEEAAAAVMATRSFNNREHVILNPWPNYHRITGGADRGSSIDTNWRWAQEKGFIPMDVIGRDQGFRHYDDSYWEKHGTKYRLQEVFECRTRDEIIWALLHDFVVGYGRSNHAILAVEMEDIDHWLYANSWGTWTNCGIPGFGRDRTTNVNFGYGAFAARCTFAEAPQYADAA